MVETKEDIKLELEKLMKILFELEEYDLCEELMQVYKNNWSVEPAELVPVHLSLIKKDE